MASQKTYHDRQDNSQQLYDALIQRKRALIQMEEEGLFDDEPAELEADQAADQIVSGSGIDAEELGTSNTQAQGKAEGEAINMENSISGSLAASKGGGQVLEDGIKSEMEGQMNTDLSDVRIHTDSNANQMSEDINAEAFTHGQDIYFKDGNFDTQSKEGKNLLAHELSHTQQQGNGAKRKVQRDKEPVYRFPILVDKAYESEDDWLKRCLGYIFGLTPDDAAVFIRAGWQFASKEVKLPKEENIGEEWVVTVPVDSFDRIIGRVVKKEPDSVFGQWIQELIEKLEELKNKYDEAYPQFDATAAKVLEEAGYRESDLNYVEVDNTNYVNPNDPNPGETEAQMIIRQEREKKFGNAFKELKQLNQLDLIF